MVLVWREYLQRVIRLLHPPDPFLYGRKGSPVSRVKEHDVSLLHANNTQQTFPSSCLPTEALAKVGGGGVRGGGVQWNCINARSPLLSGASTIHVIRAGVIRQ